MFWRYAKTDSLEKLVRDLLRIFRQLLLIFDGDVETSLDQLEHLGDRYQLWREEFGIEDFRRMLEQRGEIRRAASGDLGLTARGERALRRQALHDVFQGMAPRADGEHRTPYGGLVSQRHVPAEALVRVFLRPAAASDGLDGLHGDAFVLAE